MIRLSTGYKTRILGPTSFVDIFRFGVIRVYSGAAPLTANDAVTGTLLGSVTTDGITWLPNGAGGGGLLFEQIGEFVVRKQDQDWMLIGAAAGTMAWFRLFAAAQDDGAASISAPRIDGTIGVGGSGADLVVPSTTLSVSQTVPVQQFTYSLV